MQMVGCARLGVDWRHFWWRAVPAATAERSPANVAGAGRGVGRRLPVNCIDVSVVGGNTSRRSGGGVVGSSDRGCEAVQGLRRTLLSSAMGEAGRGEGCSSGLGERIGRPPSPHWAGGDDTVAHRVAWPDLLFVPEPCGSLGILAMCLDRMENARGSAGLSEVPS